MPSITKPREKNKSCHASESHSGRYMMQVRHKEWSWITSNKQDAARLFHAFTINQIDHLVWNNSNWLYPSGSGHILHTKEWSNFFHKALQPSHPSIQIIREASCFVSCTKHNPTVHAVKKKKKITGYFVQKMQPTPMSFRGFNMQLKTKRWPTASSPTEANSKPSISSD